MIEEIRELIGDFRYTPLGHPQRTSVLKGLMERRIPLVIEPYGMLQHRTVAINESCYILSIRGKIVVKFDGKKVESISAGKIFDLLVDEKDGQIFVIVMLINEKMREKMKKKDVDAVMRDVDFFSNTPSKMTKRKMFNNLISAEYVKLYEKIVIVAKNGSDQIVSRDAFLRDASLLAFNKIEKIEAEFSQNGIIKIFFYNN